ncbi:TPA: FxLYD domain-containing protein [Clostridium sporogenes]
MKRKIMILAIFLIIGILGLVGIKLSQAPKGTQEGQKDYTIMSEKEITKSFLDNLSKENISECVEILNVGIDPNCKDANGETLYSKAVNIVLKDAKDNAFLSKYWPMFDKMSNGGAIKSEVKIDNKEELNGNQKNFLGSIGVDIRTQEEKNKEYAESVAKIKEEEKNKPKQNFSMNGLELIEKGTTNDGRYIIGKIKNNNEFNCSYVEVKAKVTDESGNVLDTPIDNVTSLNSGEMWSFKIPVIVEGKARKYQIIEMKCNQ